MIKDRNERINFMMDYDERNKYKSLMKEQSVAEFDFFRFTKMAEQHYERAVAIFVSGFYLDGYHQYCHHLETSWYYLLCAAECGEI